MNDIMNFLSPSKYLEKIILSHLDDWVENLDASSLHIGFWEGNVELSNLRFKRRTFELDGDLLLSLEYGYIGSLIVQVPWSKLRFGGINIVVDDVHVICRLHSRELTDILNGNNSSVKMDMKSEGVPTSPAESLSQSWLLKLFSGFSVAVSNVRISLLVPKKVASDTISDHFELRFGLSSLYANSTSHYLDKKDPISAPTGTPSRYLNAVVAVGSPFSANKGSKSISSVTMNNPQQLNTADKLFGFRGFSIAIKDAQCPRTPSGFQIFASQWESANQAGTSGEVILSPVVLEGKLTVISMQSLFDAFIGHRSFGTQKLFNIDLNISNFEITPSLIHLTAIQDIVASIKSLSSSYFSQYAGSGSESAKGASVRSKSDQKILRLMKATSLDICISRIAICFVSTNERSESSSTPLYASHSNILTLGIYGFYVSYHKMELESVELSCVVGSIRLYGNKGIVIISSGGDPDYWQELSGNFQYDQSIETSAIDISWVKTSESQEDQSNDSPAHVKDDRFSNIQQIIRTDVRSFGGLLRSQVDEKEAKSSEAHMLKASKLNVPKLRATLDRIKINWDSDTLLQAACLLPRGSSKKDVKKSPVANMSHSSSFLEWLYNLDFKLTCNGVVIKFPFSSSLRQKECDDVVFFRIGSVAVSGGCKLFLRSLGDDRLDDNTSSNSYNVLCDSRLNAVLKSIGKSFFHVPILIEIKDIDVLIHTKSSPQRFGPGSRLSSLHTEKKLFLTPLSVCSLLTLSWSVNPLSSDQCIQLSTMGKSAIPAMVINSRIESYLRADIIISDLLLESMTSDVCNLIDVMADIRRGVSAFGSQVGENTSSISQTRTFGTASFCDAVINCSLSKLNASLIKNGQDEVKSIIANDLLSNYFDISAQNSKTSSFRTRGRLLLSKLEALGFSYWNSKSAVHFISENATDELKKRDVVNIGLSKLLNSKSYSIPIKPQIFSVEFDLLNIHSYFLRYDSVHMLMVDNIFVCDYNRTPVISIFYPSRYEDSHDHFTNINSPSLTRTKHKGHVSAKHSSFSENKDSMYERAFAFRNAKHVNQEEFIYDYKYSFMVCLSSRNSLWNWGHGGVSKNGRNSPISLTYDINFHIEDCNLDVFSFAILEEFNLFCDCITTFKKCYQDGMAVVNSDPSFRKLSKNATADVSRCESSVSLTTIAGKVSSFNFVLGVKSELLAEGLIAGLSFSLNSYSCNKYDGTLSLDSLSLVDLTSGGSLHDRVIWGSSHDDGPMVVSKFSMDSSCLKIDCLVERLRINLLFRFLCELEEYVSKILLGPINEKLSQFNGRESTDYTSQGNMDFGISNIDEVSDNSISSSSDSDSDSESETIRMHKTPIRSRVHLVTGKFLTPKVSSQPLKSSNDAPFEEFSKVSTSNFVEDFSVKWCIHCHDIVIIAPRSSISRDLVAIVVKESSFSNMKVLNSWEMINCKESTTTSSSCDFETSTLYFDLSQNCWSNDPSLQNNMTLSSKTPRTIIPFGSVFMSEDLDKAENSDDEFYDTNEKSDMTDIRSVLDELVSLPKFSSLEFTASPNPDERWDKEENEGIYDRIACRLSMIDIFISISGPIMDNLCNIGSYDDVMGYYEVTDNGPVYYCSKSKNADRNTSANQVWKCVTKMPFELLLVIDTCKGKTSQLLISDTSKYSSLSLSLSMAELNLLTSVWFDNFYEVPRFFVDEVAGYINSQESHAERPPPDKWYRYGSLEFIHQLRGCKKSWNIAIIKSNVELDCSVDVNYFWTEPYSLKYLLSMYGHDSQVTEAYEKFVRFRMEMQGLDTVGNRQKRRNQYDEMNSIFAFLDKWERLSVPFASIKLGGVVLQIQLSPSTVQLAVGASSALVADIINSRTGKSFVVLSLPSGDATSLYPTCSGFGDATMDFSLGFTPSSVANGEAFCESCPIRFSFFNAEDMGWKICNIGLDLTNLSLASLNFVYVISDYFSCYYRFPGFGHPGVSFESQIAKSNIPYGCMDVRLYLTRPHITILRVTEAVPQPTLIFESDKGIYFRYMFDSNDTMKMEFQVFDLAVVLTKNFVSPSSCRGIRGSAGSGKGIRTLMEYLSFGLSYNFDGFSRQQDVLLKVVNDFNSTNETTEGVKQGKKDTPYVDFSSQCINFEAPSIPSPVTVISLSRSKEPKTLNTCDIVSSYEDLLFAVSTVKRFLGLVDSPKEEASPSDPNLSKSFFAVISICGMRFILVDNVLGLHLPLIQVYIDTLSLTFDVSKSMMNHDVEQSRTLDSMGKLALSNKRENIDNSSSNSVMFFAQTTFWSDYFNNVRKCWEPLLERFEVSAILEKGSIRGSGLTVRTSSILHLNLTVYLVRSINDILSMIQSTTEKSLDLNKNNAPNEDHDDTVRKSIVSSDVGVSEKQLLNISGAKASNSSSIPAFAHVASKPLPYDTRVGFSIQNLLGQPMRFLQQWADGHITVQYVNHEERCLLNFIASTTVIRNNDLLEEAFNVQLEDSQRNTKGQKGRVGHQVSIQVSGFECIDDIQADVLSVKYHDLVPLLRKKDAFAIKNSNWMIRNALKLVTEVLPHNGGRLLRLRSVFSIRNETNHRINLFANKGTNERRNSISARHDVSNIDKFSGASFFLDSGENFFVPSALLQVSAMSSNGSSLGELYIRPASLDPAEKELGSKPQAHVEQIDYAVEPIDLFNIVKRTSELVRDFSLDPGSLLTGEELNDPEVMQLCCYMHVKTKRNKSHSNSDGNLDRGDELLLGSNRLPPFCYNIEVHRSGVLIKENLESNKGSQLQALKDKFFGDRENDYQMKLEPIHYSIVIHPPIILENLLPTGGLFEIIHATQQKRVLWSSWIPSGKAMPIHTVSLEDPLILLINLRYCRTPDGVVIHRPVIHGERGFAKRLKQTLEGFLDESVENEGVTSVILTDIAGQRLTLNLENNEGLGGRRHVTIYCPYWIMNTSQYAIRVREDNAQLLPAGSVTPQRDGTRPVAFVSSAAFQENMPSHIHDLASTVEHVKNSRSMGVERREHLGGFTIFPGKRGPLHSSQSKEFSMDSPLTQILQEMEFEDIVDYSYMFNFNDEARILGKKKVTIQMDDSDWAKPFSLDSVGVNQIVAVDDPERGIFELGFKIKLAPGRLGKYTKIVRFMPKFALINKMTSAIHVSQPVGFDQSKKVFEVSPHFIRPFHLPAVSGERTLTLQVDGPWIRSVPFSIDRICSFTLNLRKKIELASIRHVNTRGASEYTVQLPPQEIGIWFETDWIENCILVKSFREGSFASRFTEIQRGDVLIAIDGESVQGKKFELVMMLLKSKLNSVGCEVTFRTVEEKLRLIREKSIASPANKTNHSSSRPSVTHSESDGRSTEEEDTSSLNQIAVRVELKSIESSSMIIFREVNPEVDPEYRINNESPTLVLHFKQKGLAGNPWTTLLPGQSTWYIWDDPFKPHKLLVRIGKNLLNPESSTEQYKEKKNSAGMLGSWSRNNHDQFNAEIPFDEIGKQRSLSIPRTDARLFTEVRSYGPTKTLVISPDSRVFESDLSYAVQYMKEQSDLLCSFVERFELVQKSGASTTGIHKLLQLTMDEIIKKLSDKQTQLLKAANESFSSNNANSASMRPTDKSLTSYSPVESVLGVHIFKQNQLFVEIIEAKDILPIVSGKMEDVFCRVFLRTQDRNYRKSCKQPHNTYVCEQTLDPMWFNQVFLFDVPEAAAGETRKYSLRFEVKSKGVVQFSRYLGVADVHLSCLKNEDIVEGWFPLRPDKYSITAGTNSNSMCGSIRLRIRWVHSNTGLAKCILDTVRERIGELKSNFEVQEKVLKEYSERQIASSAWSIAKKANPFEMAADGVGEVVSSLVSTTARLTGEMIKNFRNIARNDEENGDIIKFATTTPVRSSVAYSGTALNAAGVWQETAYSNTVGADLYDVSENDTSTDMEKDDFVAQSTPVVAKSQDSTSLSPRRYSSSTPSRRKSDISSFIKNRTLHPYFLTQWCKDLSFFQSMRLKPVPNSNEKVFADEVMLRSPRAVEDNLTFARRCDQECMRSFKHAHSTKLSLFITPMQALHLPNVKKYVHCKLSYGEMTQSTFSIPPAADLSWYQDDRDLTYHDTRFSDEPSQSAPGKKDYQRMLNDSLTKAFYIETLNIKGNIRLVIASDDIAFSNDLAILDIPILSLLDCVCLLDEGDVYDRWFPLLLSAECLPTEGEIGNPSLKLISERESYEKFGHRRPCIRLRVSWKSHDSFPSACKFYTRIQIPSVSLSIIDSYRAREVAQWNINEIDIRHSNTEKYTDTMMNVAWFQVDNQLPEAIANVISSPTQVKIHQPVLRFKLRQNNHLSTPMLSSFDSLELIIQELDVRLEQQTVVAFWTLYQSLLLELRASSAFGFKNSERRTHINLIEKLGFATCFEANSLDLLAILKVGNSVDEKNSIHLALTEKDDFVHSTSQSKNIYVESLFFGPIKLNVSFITSSDVISNTRFITSQTSISDDINVFSSVMTFLRQVGEVVLNLTSSISDAPIIFAGYRVPHLLISEIELVKTLLDHYMLSALGQLYKIVGSLDLVGNPIGLVQSLGIGVKDFFIEPAHALITSPNDIRKIGHTMVKGAISIVSNTTDGMIGTGTTITRSVGRNIAKLTMDPAFLKSREELQRLPANIADAATRPIKDVVNGVYFGVIGLVKVPYNNTKKYGPAGLLTGVMKGIVGVAAKPVVGVLDAITHTGETVREVVKISTRQSKPPLHRLKLSNLFGPDGRILPYDPENALGTYILRRLDAQYSDRKTVANALSDSVSVMKRLGSVTSKNPSNLDASLHQHPHSIQFSRSLSEEKIDSADVDVEIMETGGKRKKTSILKRLSNNFIMARRGSAIARRASAIDNGDSISPTTLPFQSPDGASSKLIGLLAGAEEKEFVVHTTVVNESPGVDTFAIVTSSNIVIAQYIRKLNGSLIREVWRSSLSNLAYPIFDHRGGKVIISLKSQRDSTATTPKAASLPIPGGDHSSGKKTESDHNVFVIQADYEFEDDMNILYNVILAITRLGTSFRIITSSLKFHEDEAEIVHIGPWQYSIEITQGSGKRDSARKKRSGSVLSSSRTYEIQSSMTAAVEHLHESQWMIRTTALPHRHQSLIPITPETVTNLNEKTVPEWLEQVINAAMSAHEESMERKKARRNNQKMTILAEPKNSASTIIPSLSSIDHDDNTVSSHDHLNYSMSSSSNVGAHEKSSDISVISHGNLDVSSSPDIPRVRLYSDDSSLQEGGPSVDSKNSKEETRKRSTTMERLFGLLGDNLLYHESTASGVENRQTNTNNSSNSNSNSNSSQTSPDILNRMATNTEIGSKPSTIVPPLNLEPKKKNYSLSPDDDMEDRMHSPFVNSRKRIDGNKLAVRNSAKAVTVDQLGDTTTNISPPSSFSPENTQIYSQLLSRLNHLEDLITHMSPPHSSRVDSASVTSSLAHDHFEFTDDKILSPRSSSNSISSQLSPKSPLSPRTSNHSLNSNVEMDKSLISHEEIPSSITTDLLANVGSTTSNAPFSEENPSMGHFVDVESL